MMLVHRNSYTYYSAVLYFNVIIFYSPCLLPICPSDNPSKQSFLTFLMIPITLQGKFYKFHQMKSVWLSSMLPGPSHSQLFQGLKRKRKRKRKRERTNFSSQFSLSTLLLQQELSYFGHAVYSRLAGT